MGRNIRLIARLDVKGAYLIKSINLEGLRKIGDPGEYAKKYYADGADEIIYMDPVASLYGRNSLLDIVEKATRDVFIPITVGGGVRTLSDVEKILKSGADKVAVNTAAIKRPELIREIATRFGSQCMVLSIEAKQSGPDLWEAYYDNGRERSGREVIEWARQGVALGAGEILLTSVDREGSARGFDSDLVKKVGEAVSIPIIASGGMGHTDHLIHVVKEGKADAVAMAHVLHYNKLTFMDIREKARQEGLPIRSTRNEWMN